MFDVSLVGVAMECVVCLIYSMFVMYELKIVLIKNQFVLKRQQIEKSYGL